MADRDHLRRLRAGVSAWNMWRKAQPDVIPDLRGANLSGASLIKGDFRSALLAEADLGGANCAEADFSEADLSDIQATDASFSGARFRRTNLARANLQGARFCYDTDLGLAWAGQGDAPSLRTLYFGMASAGVWLLTVVVWLIWGQREDVSMAPLFISAPGLSALLLCNACWPPPGRETHTIYALSFLGYFCVNLLTIQDVREINFILAVLDALKGLVVSTTPYGPWTQRVLWLLLLILCYWSGRGVKRAWAHASSQGFLPAPAFWIKAIGVVLGTAGLYAVTALTLGAPLRPEFTLLATALCLWFYLGMIGYRVIRSACFYGVDLSEARLCHADLSGTAFAPDTSEARWIKEDHPFSWRYKEESPPSDAPSGVSIFPDPDYKVAAVYPNAFRGLDLRDASLENACFFDTVFDQVHLEGVSFGAAHLDRIAFVECDLSTVGPPAPREDTFDGPVGTSTTSNFAEQGLHYAQLSQALDLRGARNVPSAWRASLGSTRCLEDGEVLRGLLAASWNDLCGLFPFIEWARKNNILDEAAFKDFVREQVEPERVDVTTGSILRYLETAFPPAGEEGDEGVEAQAPKTN